LDPEVEIGELIEEARSTLAMINKQIEELEETAQPGSRAYQLHTTAGTFILTDLLAAKAIAIRTLFEMLSR
jgi:hypothetical protein